MLLLTMSSTKNFVMKTCENFEQTDQHCQPKKWDQSQLELIDQTMIEGTVCAPQKLSMTLKKKWTAYCAL
ncbi:hypothetical protein BsIDN1_43090 [Bacillus safensis]|uniref:Uncharacterized protein n=1 Tax=Bacillus safensis TaxID=561879 RepID=A0A5S9MCP2_BACIA|nr:hypothetical protein BsIDN1_43090 [Bacillus safensis]